MQRKELNPHWWPEADGGAESRGCCALWTWGCLAGNGSPDLPKGAEPTHTGASVGTTQPGHEEFGLSGSLCGNLLGQSQKTRPLPSTPGPIRQRLFPVWPSCFLK